MAAPPATQYALFGPSGPFRPHLPDAVPPAAAPTRRRGSRGTPLRLFEIDLEPITCQDCGRPLTNARSRRAGKGRRCRAKRADTSMPG